MKPPHIPYNPFGNLDTMELQVEKNTEIETEAWFTQGLLGEPEAVLPCVGVEARCRSQRRGCARMMSRRELKIPEPSK